MTILVEGIEMKVAGLIPSSSVKSNMWGVSQVLESHGICADFQTEQLVSSLAVAIRTIVAREDTSLSDESRRSKRVGFFARCSAKTVHLLLCIKLESQDLIIVRETALG